MDPNILGNKGDLHIPGPQLSTSIFNIIYKNNLQDLTTTSTFGKPHTNQSI